MQTDLRFILSNTFLILAGGFFESRFLVLRP
jgi:hypothetical protein